MEERVKHRLAGIAVIVSLGVIVAPAVLKKSSQPYDLQKTANYRIPKRPHIPNIAVADEEETFNSVKIVHIDLDKPQKHQREPLKIAQATAIKSIPVKSVSHSSKVEENISAPKKTGANVPEKPVTTSLKNKSYAVQLASFTQSKNANLLVLNLSKKGFNAKTLRRANRNGRIIYQVVVGNEKKKASAKKLQQQLAQATKLKGIVIHRHLG